MAVEGAMRATSGVVARFGSLLTALPFTICLILSGGGPARASSDFPVSSTTIRAVIEASRDDKGDIVSLRKNIGLYILEDDAAETSERELFDKLVFSEMQLLGRMLPLNFKNGARPKNPLADKYSQLVIFRDADDTKIAEYETEIPGFGAAVRGVRDQLNDSACSFFDQEDSDNSDDLLVAYVFVGRNNARPSSCLHSGLLKAFGVQRRPGDQASYADRFLVDLIGMQLIDRCSQLHGPQRVSCVMGEIDTFK
jgi:hypothetical protein